MAFRVFLAWHSATQRIYVGFEGIDDMLWPYSEGSNGEGFMAGNGSFGFSVDGDHSAGKYQFFTSDGYTEAESRRRFGAQAQGYNIRQDRPDGTFFGIASWADWASRPPWGDAGYERYGEAPSRIIKELWVTPWDDLNPDGPEASRRSDLFAGKIIGITMNVTDFDDSNGPDGFFYLVPIRFSETVSDGSFGHQGFAENFADAELIPCTVSDCGSSPETAVRTVSWGRIKASLR